MCPENLEQEYKEVADFLPNTEKVAGIISEFGLCKQEEVRLYNCRMNKICCRFVRIWYNQGKLRFGYVFCKMISLVFLTIDL